MTAPARERTPFNNPGVTAFARASTADMAELLREGYTPAEVAEAFGMSWAGVRDRLIEGGWSSGTGQPMTAKRPPQVAAEASRDLSWQERAICVGADPEMFFPEKGHTAIRRAAKEVCASCPVMRECLDHAMANGGLVGIWGGTTWSHRDATRRGLTNRAETIHMARQRLSLRHSETAPSVTSEAASQRPIRLPEGGC